MAFFCDSYNIMNSFFANRISSYGEKGNIAVDSLSLIHICLGPYSSLIPLINENCDKYNLYGLGNIDEKRKREMREKLEKTIGFVK